MDIVEKTINKYISSGYFPGCVAACGSANQIYDTRSYGMAEYSPYERKMSHNSIFDIASITKVVATATAIGQMLDKGILYLETPVAHLLPEYKQFFADNLTVRHLATHTSGFSNKKPNSKLTGEKVINSWLSIPPVEEVDSTYVYACKNSVMLGLIVERLSGKNFGDYCRQNIFSPLGMHDTFFGPIKPSKRLVRCGKTELGEICDEPANAIGRPVGNAGVFSTINDLSIFAQMMLKGGKINGAMIMSMKTVKKLTSIHSKHGLHEQGVCWKVFRKPDAYNSRPESLSEETYFHGGYTGQSIWIDPKKNIFVIVLTNRLHGELATTNSDWYKFLTNTNIARARIGEALMQLHKN